MQIRRSRLVLALSFGLAVAVSSCGKPPVPVQEQQSTPPISRTRELPPGHPPMDGGAAEEDHSGHDHPPGQHPTTPAASEQVDASAFHFSGVLRISGEMHDRGDAAVFLSVRDQQTNELILSSRHTMDQFEADGDGWVVAYRLDDSHRMMGGTSRPKNVAIKASYTPGGMLPAIGSTQPIAGSVTKTTSAVAGVADHEIVLE